ncbi:MAG: filamentous hemagglutinin N-terminal domain-containing protein [Leptolyngbya sp. SIOISBB]|nr:filamentous hemagglutinin N-terminal domain-containing protein [Leptolyngbya sp. SIOISBB]
MSIYQQTAIAAERRRSSTASRQLLQGLFIATIASLFIEQGAVAQLLPDDSLGGEGSLLTDGLVDGLQTTLIEGGAKRGGNLFHSFQDFNVGEGQRVYFANPLGIENILSRVTGGDPSNILGTLGVAGLADLFLLNPNGIVFGPDATLDVAGSFYGTTADAIPLGDGVFSATDPEQNSLLTVDPGIVFTNYLNEDSGDITNRGQLAAQGDLTLAANNLDLQGQVAAGGDLTLLGLDTVQIRDTAEVPFIGFAGGDLLVQGNEQVDIVALSHPDSGLYSYGDMVLRSANPVGGDAHYWSAGSFQVETLDGEVGDLFSPVDPIIRTFNDVVIDEYEGSSLHILAGGSVNLGTATITDPDAGDLDIDFLREDITLSDGTVVQVDGGAQPTLDVRAGVSPEALGEPPLDLLTGFNNNTVDEFEGDAFVTAAPTSADIMIGTVFVNSRNGLVLLTNQYQPNNQIAGGNILIESRRPNTNGFSGIVAAAFGGGEVVLDARNHISIIDSGITTLSLGESGSDITLLAGGTLRLDSPNGRPTGVVTGTPPTAISKGGDIRVIATNLELANGAQLNSSTIGSEDAGHVFVVVHETAYFDGGNTGIRSNVMSGATGNGGTVTLSANNLEVTNGANLSALTAGIGDAGDVHLSINETARFDGVNPLTGNPSGAFSTINASGEGNGGTVTLSANNLEVTNGAVLTASTFGSGDAGDVNVTISETARLDGVNPVTGTPSGAFSTINASGEGNGGTVTLSASNLEVTNGANLSALTAGMGNAGNVHLTISETAHFDGVNPVTGTPSGVFSSIEVNGEGNGGTVTLSANNLEVTNGANLSALTAGIGNAGNVHLTISETARLEGVNPVTGTPSGVFSTIRASGEGNGGTVTLSASNLEVTNGANLTASTFGIGNAGNVNMTISETARFDDANVSSGVFPDAVGNGGNIKIMSNTLELTNGGEIGTSTLGQGRAGNVVIQARERVLIKGTSSSGSSSNINSASVSFTGEGGDIHITTPNLQIEDGASLFASTFVTPSGSIILSLNRLSIINGGQVIASSFGSGSAGSIRIDAKDSLLISGNDPTFAVRATQSPVLDLMFTPQSSLSVRSVTTGAAGNIIIGELGNTPRLVLDNGGQIIAESAAVDGGNITLNLTDLLLLRNGSLISASAGTEQARGNGGNINISASFIVAIPEENSDIAADAFEGSGGNVTINASGVFGIEPRTRRTPLSDITASSELGITGTVNFNVLDTGFIENNLSDFDENIVDTAALTAGSCIARADETDSSFVVTGGEGLPQQPGNEGPAGFPTNEVRGIDGPVAQPAQDSVGQSSRSILEPTGVYELNDGRLVLSHECS